MVENWNSFKYVPYKCSLNHWTGNNIQFTKFKFKCISCNYPFVLFWKKKIYAIEKLLCLWAKLISLGFLCIYHIHVLGSNMKLWRLIQLVKIAQGNYQYNLHLSVLHTYKDRSIIDRLIFPKTIRFVVL